MTWYRYGDAAPPRPEEQDPLLDRFMPSYDVAERHHVRIAAPSTLTLAAAREVDLQGSPIVRAIIKAREVILGAIPDDRPRLRGLLAEVQSLGWGVLAEVPEWEIVVGAVTKPWEANVTFRALPPDRFAAFSEPGYVKIALDAPCGVDRCDWFNLPDGNACRSNRRNRAGQVPAVLGVPRSRHHLDSMGHSRTS
jgi:hypothetical protein